MKSSKPAYILHITYGYVGIWNNELTNMSTRKFCTFEHIDPGCYVETEDWIEEHRSHLLLVMRNILRSRSRDSFGDESILSMCHIISESLISTTSYF